MANNFENEPEEKNTNPMMTNGGEKCGETKSDQTFVKGTDLTIKLNNDIQCDACLTKDMTRVKILAHLVNQTKDSNEKAEKTSIPACLLIIAIQLLRNWWNFRLFALIVLSNRSKGREDASLWTIWQVQLLLIANNSICDGN